TKAVPVRAVSADVGSYLHWAADSKSLHWMVGDRYHSRRLDQTFDFLPGAPAEIAKPAAGGGIAVGLEAPVYAARDVVAFTNARIVTMRDAENAQEVIEGGTIVVDGNTIRAIGGAGA